jgi:hypothetical protein
MLDWLYNTVYSLYGSISGPVKDFVHSVMRGLVGALNAVSGNMWTVWWNWVAAMWTAGGVFSWFCGGVYNVLSWVVKESIPFISNLALTGWTRVLALEHKVATVVRQWVDDAIATAQGLVNDAITWVNQHIWLPLWSNVQDLYDKMTRWAYTAYYYVTHPDALAEVIFWSLWGVFTRSAFSVARTVGEWLLRTFLANAVAGVQLVESVVADVL